MVPKFTDIKETLLVTHMGCMDGAGCAIMFMYAGGKKENIRYVKAGMLEQFVKKEPEIKGGKFIIFADLGFNDPKYADMLEKRGNCVILDHHNTSVFLKDRTWCNIDMNACGSELTRQYLGIEDEEAKKFAALIDDHDRWLRKDPRSEQMAAFMSFVRQASYISRFKNFKDRFNWPNGIFSDFEIDLLGILDKNREESVRLAIEKMIVKDIPHPKTGETIRVGYTTSADPNISIILNEMLNARPDIVMSVQISLNQGSISLRSRGDFDVSEFASHFGGGGHKSASGHRMPRGFIENLIEELHGG